MEKTILVGNTARCPMRVVLNAVDARSSVQYRAKLAAEMYGAPVSPCVIGHRIDFSHAVVEGLSVLEYNPKSKASIEVQALFRYISREMEAENATV